MHTSHISRRQRSLKVFCAAQFRSVRSLFVMLAVALCMAAGASAQENKQYTQNAPDQSLKSDARVDPSTLGMSVSVPLGGAPGRAGSSLPVSLRYSSKQWRIKHTLSWFTTAGSAKSWTHALFSENATAGWTSSLEPPRIEFTAEQQLFDDFGVAISDDPQAPPANAYYIRRLNVHLPDGSSHELRKDDAPQWLDRTNPVYDYTGMFYAVDGSGARYDATNGVLYLADGSRYIFGARQTITRYSRTVDGRWGTTYIDRNGNTLTYNLSTKTWSDTLGRSYAQPLPDDPTVGLQTYSLPGVGGHTLSYTLHWQNLGDSLRAPEAVRYTSNKRCATPNSYPALSPSLFTGGPLLGAYICGDVFNPVVLAKIVLPDGQFYEFKYNVWGEIEQVNAPGGGYERFRYDKVPTLGEVNRPYDEANRGVVEHWISPSGTGVEETTHRWQYSLTRLTSSGGAVATTTAPEGVTRSERVLYSSGTGDYGFGNPLAGMISEERVYNASNVMLRRTLNGWSVITPAGSTRARDPHLTKSVSLILDTGGNALASTTEMHYDADLNVDWTKKYDYASVASSTAQTGAITSIPNGALVRTDETTYLVNDTAISSTVRQSYRDRNLTGLPSSSRIKNSAGTIVAQSEYKYDEAAYPLLTYGAVTGWTDPATSVRGNATTTRSWLDTASAWVEAHAQYDQTGNARYMWDAKGNLSEVEYSSAYHYAYPTLTRSAIPDATSTRGSNTALVTTSVYDFWTGRVTSTKDANGQVNGLSTTYEYNDALDRLTKVNNPDGGWTTYWYGHNAYGDYTGTRTAINATQNTEGYQFFDGLGRAVRSFQLEGSQWITSDTEYDSMGRVKRVSNPYLTGGSGTPINPSGYWTTTAYDALGRTSTVTKPDNAQVTNAYSGNMVTVTDPAGKARRSVTDALGRLVQVVEAPAGVAYPTNYTYDERGNLRKVNQSGQLRYFMYDSLGRLIRARNPEQSVNSGLALQDSFKAPDDAAPNGQWTLGYAYDNNGNLSAKTDARGVTASYTYDPLNRVLDIGYSDGVTPGVGVVYDKAANGRGRFSWNWAYMGPSAANSHTAIDSYDAMGRVTVQRQHFWVNSDWGQAYTISRSYDLAGHVVSQTYPSGHTVNYSQFDVAGRLKQFTGNLGNGVTRTYATNISYDEASRMREEQFGTTSALYHKLHYNVRGQLYDVRLSTVAWATDEWNWNRGALVNHFSSVNGWAATGTDNNGNVLLAQHWVPNNDQISSYQWMNQYYTYDALNRLASVMEQANGATTTGAQVFIYDAFGNRTVDAAQTWGTNIPEPQYTASTATNRLGVPSGYSGVMSYDAAGNLTYDTHTSSPAPGTRFYDAENRMTAAYYPNNQLASAYTYDADGRRTRRKILGSEAWQVYGIDGELLAEYAGGGAPSAPQKEYGYRNGELLVTAESAGQVNWIVSDHLGTPRIVADLSGTLANTKRHDYLPFGEELFAGTGGRTTGQGYVADNIRQKFTGKERDNETELDYFLARYYSPAQGRFTSPDEFSGGPDELFDFVDDAADNPTFYADIANPQSLNKYQYCYNNPINLIDPDGHETDDTDFDQEQQSSLKPVLNPDRDITQKPYGSQPYDTEKRKKERLDYQQYRVDCQKAGLCVDSIERIPDPSIIDNPRNRTRNTTSPSSQPGEIRRRQTGKPPGNTRPSSSSPKMSKGGKQNKRDSEFANKGDKEISKKARDKSLPAKERRRYQTEEKARKERNKQKRESQ